MSLFTAVLATQAIILSLRGSKILSSRSALGAGSCAKRKITFDFMGASKWFFSASGVILLVAPAIAGNGLNFGIDFESGTRITAPLTRSASVEDVRNALGLQGLGDAKIQTVDNPELGKNVVQTRPTRSRPRTSARSTRRSTTASGWRTTPTSSRSDRRSASRSRTSR